ncbi:GNAT family N-acetyltransferase [Kocuria sp.]|uniref:GNAT family N-acetyltransferase n=1 Tax=Kocuria sp. TaxID=1871328 RepID=UPI00289912F5|nr:GNAT family N-acetyltransferase [Kocuria sp.]
MTVVIRPANPSDFDFLQSRDTHVAPRELHDLVERGRVLIAMNDGEPVGWLRWNLFWDEHPFMNMLYVLEPHRGQGISRRLIEVWEDDCRQRGHAFVMTSTLSTEDAQHLYRHLGYRDAGHLDLPAEPRELVLLHAL